MPRTLHALLVLALLFLLTACATTRVAVVEDRVIGNSNIHIFVASDEVDDPMDVGVYLVKAFEEHGIQFSLPLRHSYWKHDDEQGPLEVRFLDGGVRADSGDEERSFHSPD